jgi:hypothetical protein
MTKASRQCMVMLLAVCITPGLAADALTGQRLFTTPAQRARLDQGHREPAAQSAQETARTTTAAAQRAVTLTGVVDRPDGPSAFWLDGRRFLDGRALPATVPGRRGWVAGDRVVVTRADGTKVALEPTDVLQPRPRRGDRHER